MEGRGSPAGDSVQSSQGKSGCGMFEELEETECGGERRLSV